MFVWWFIGLFGYSCVIIIHCQDKVPELANIDTSQEGDVRGDPSADISDPPLNTDDTNNLAVNEVMTTTIISTATQTPEPFSCYECTNCSSKPDFVSRVCESGVTMCYIMHKRIDNTSQIIRRGCSTSKAQCTAPDDDQTNSFESITCCTNHKCNQATHFKPLFFLSTLSLFAIYIVLNNI